MPVRRSHQEVFTVSGPLDAWLPRCKQALEATGFSHVRVSDILHQITGQYRTWTVCGEIEITVHPSGDQTRIDVEAVAAGHHVFALFRSPTKRILAEFKRGLGV